MSEFKTMNIFEKMLAISGEIETIKRTASIQKKSGETYKSLTEKAVLDAVKPLETKYGVFSYPVSSSKTERLIEREYYFENQARKTQKMIFSLDMTYRFVNVDNPDQTIEITSYGIGVDSSDKAPGKAMTYAAKYALLKAYKICAEDDGDELEEPLDGYTTIPEVPETVQAAYDQVPIPYSESKKRTQEPQQEAPIQPFAPPLSGTQMSIEAPAPASQEEPSRSVGMTVEEAKALVIPHGPYKGRTLGEMLALNRGKVEYYAYKMQNPRHAALIQASRLILEQDS